MFEKIKIYFENREGAVRKMEERETRKIFFKQLREVEAATCLNELPGEEIWPDLVDACAVLAENDVSVSGPETAARVKKTADTVLAKMTADAIVTDTEFEAVVAVSPSAAQLFEQYQDVFLSQKRLPSFSVNKPIAA